MLSSPIQPSTSPPATQLHRRSQLRHPMAFFMVPGSALEIASQPCKADIRQHQATESFLLLFSENITLKIGNKCCSCWTSMLFTSTTKRPQQGRVSQKKKKPSPWHCPREQDVLAGHKTSTPRSCHLLSIHYNTAQHSKVHIPNPCTGTICSCLHQHLHSQLHVADH